MGQRCASYCGKPKRELAATLSENQLHRMPNALSPRHRPWVVLCVPNPWFGAPPNVGRMQVVSSWAVRAFQYAVEHGRSTDTKDDDGIARRSLRPAADREAGAVSC